MLSVNSVQLIGNIGKEVTARALTQEHNVVNFSVATSRNYKNKEGKWESETTWHKIVAFNVSDYTLGGLVKGMPVYIQGRIQNRSYEGKSGTVYITEIVAEKIIPLQKVEFTEQPEELIHEENTQDPFKGNDDDLPF